MHNVVLIACITLVVAALYYRRDNDVMKDKARKKDKHRKEKSKQKKSKHKHKHSKRRSDSDSASDSSYDSGTSERTSCGTCGLGSGRS